MTNKAIPIYRPFIDKTEEDLVNDCMKSTWISSKGDYINKFEEQIKKYIKADYCTTTSSGTSALHLAMLALDIGQDDEVITTNFTYVASTNAILYVGAKPVFCNIRSENLNIDIDSIESKITPKTKAILYTNVYGFLCDYDRLNEIAKKYGLFLIEDAAESFSARYKGRMSGTLGDISTFSFFGNKTITTGEGGMVMCKNLQHYNKIKKLKNQGNSERTYFHDVLGYNYRMTNIQAAIGIGQLDKVDKIISLKKSLYNNYKSNLENKVRFIKELEGTEPSYWMTPIIFDSQSKREKVEIKLKENSIETRPLFTPIDQLPFYEKSSSETANRIYKLGILLPSYPGLSDEDQNKICKIINSII
tara:strand:- start:94 stop:1176 length:1083 start_codon:yes stop_codon:yes gene_type:complete